VLFVVMTAFDELSVLLHRLFLLSDSAQGVRPHCTVEGGRWLSHYARCFAVKRQPSTTMWHIEPAHTYSCVVRLWVCLGPLDGLLCACYRQPVLSRQTLRTRALHRCPSRQGVWWSLQHQRQRLMRQRVRVCIHKPVKKSNRSNLCKKEPACFLGA
jgi:hypothetical protein